MTNEPALIGIDWGTTNRRGWLLGRDGAVLDRRDDDRGILAVEAGGYPAALAGLVAGWPELPVVMSGMVGSRQGWIEAPYLRCPAAPEALAEGLVEVEGDRPVMLVPGLAVDEPGGRTDVMRGEETQVLGALGGAPGGGLESGTVLLPGTHAKWVRLADRRIETFRTYMTGEVYGLLLNHSLLGRGIDGQAWDWAAFERGLGGDGASPLARIFEARSGLLLGRLSASEVPAFLSGVLVSAELDAALADAEGSGGVTVIGGARLSSVYETALKARGIAVTMIGEEATARGLFLLGRQAGLVAMEAGR